MTDNSKISSNSSWNYHPELPLADNFIFKWPPDPSFLAKWLRSNWLSLSERVLMLLLALALWVWACPDLETAQDFSFGWIAKVWILHGALASILAYANATSQNGVVSSGVGRVLLVAGAGFIQIPTLQKAI